MKKHYNIEESAQSVSPFVARRSLKLETLYASISWNFDEEHLSPSTNDGPGWTIHQLNNAPETVKRLAIVAGVVDERFFARIERPENRSRAALRKGGAA